MAFVLFIIVIIPQASVDLTDAANRQTAQLEVHSMMSTLFHGYEFNIAGEAEGGDYPITDYQAISYLICGKNPTTGGGWFEVSDQERIDTGDIELASHYEVRLESMPDFCGSNKWTTPSGSYGTDGEQSDNQIYRKTIPLQNGHKGSIAVVYGFE